MNIINKTKKKIINHSPFKRKKIFGRVACFGRVVIEDRDLIRNSRVRNFQKARIDYLNAITNHEIIHHADIERIKEVIKSEEILEFQKNNLSLLNYNFKDIDIFLFDTFSELTDKEMRFSENNKIFYSHKKDLKNKIFEKKIVDKCNLLEISKI